MFVCLFVCFSCIREVRKKGICLASGTENFKKSLYPVQITSMVRNGEKGLSSAATAFNLT